jgi:hypothetical protein
MFPPKIAESLEEGISNLWASLERAGEQWSRDVRMDTGEDTTRVILPMSWAMAESAEKDVAAYIKSYMLRTGWKVRRVKITKRYVELIVSNV